MRLVVNFRVSAIVDEEAKFGQGLKRGEGGEGEGRRKRRCRVFLNETSRQKTATPIMYSRRK